MYESRSNFRLSQNTYDKYEGADGITYLNVAITNTDTNNNPVNNAQVMLTSLTEIRGESIIDNPDDYFVTVSRFSIPLWGTTLINMANYIRAGQSDVNLTNFSFTLSYNGIDSVQTFLVYVPTITSRSSLIPTSPVPVTGAIQTLYYFLYDYTLFLQICNTALQSAFASLSGLTSLPAGSLAPYFIYDPVTQLISLIVQADNYDQGSSPYIQIWFNNLLLPFFHAIPNSHPAGNLSNGKTNIFTVGDLLNNSYTSPVPSFGSALQMSQQYVSLGYWNSFKSLLITTNTLPIKPEAIPPAPSVQGALESNLASSNINTRLILTDFVPDLLNNAGTYSTIATYTPGFSDYRLINMYTSQPIRQINLEIFWVDTYGNIFPIILYQGQTANIKLAFIPKKFYLHRSPNKINY